MTPSTPHAVASWRAILGAQLRAVAIAVRPALVVAATILAAVAVIALLAALRDGEIIPFTTEFALSTALAGLLIPVAVWRGEYDIQRSYLASLPVNRLNHVLTKIAAGWIWLMALTGAFVLGMLALALATGGPVGVDEVRVMAHSLPGSVTSEEAAAFARRWTTPWWQWAVFITTPTVAYLLGSAVVLAGSRVRRWLVGFAALLLFFLLLAEQGFQLRSAGTWLVDGLQAVTVGSYGIRTLFAIADNQLVAPPTGEAFWAWGDPPTIGTWALTTLLWTSLALAAVLFAARRERNA